MSQSYARYYTVRAGLWLQTQHTTARGIEKV